MKLVFIRHAEPDYEHDSLTEKGFREAEYLSGHLGMLRPAAVYLSPMGRAKATAAPTLKKLKMTAEECPWLREFNNQLIWRPDNPNQKMIPWDWLPADWSGSEALLHHRRWSEDPRMLGGKIGENYAHVTQSFDALLAKHGYVRQDGLYRAEAPSHDTILFFCHLGVTCVLLSHLLNVSPMILWHGSCPLPSSVTRVVTEERRPGLASFRILELGSLAHLYAHGEEPSFMARFCECYGDGDRCD